jgi:hypothetical protein
VAVDDAGRALTSIKPTGGSAAWTRVLIDGRWGFYGVSCAGALCVAVDAGGNVVVGRLPLPDTKITKATVNKAQHSATFNFKTTGVASGFQCKLKRAGAKASFSPCHSAKTYKNLAAGSYTFFVRAKNAAGADPTPASSAFKI